MAALDMICDINILVDGHRLQKHRNEFGEYVLSRPDKVYEILLESPARVPAVAEVFVDGHSALCPPRRTRLLRNKMRIRGFEKRRIDLGGDEFREEAFEYTPFVFTLPQTEEDRNHLELGLIRIELYEPHPVEVVGRRRRDLAGEIQEPSIQPRQGKKANGLERMTTKEGDNQLTRPHALSRSAVHTVYNKGAFIGEVELRYYNGGDQILHRHMLDPAGGGDSHSRHGRRPATNLRRSGIFSGSGVRLGGNGSRSSLLAALGGNRSNREGSQAVTEQASEAAAHDEEEDDLQRAIALSMQGVDAVHTLQASSPHARAPASVISTAGPLQSSTYSSHGDEECYFCLHARTKKHCMCLSCQRGHYAVCQACLDSGRAVCHQCGGSNFEVGTDPQLRSNEGLESSQMSSGEPRTKPHGCPTQFYLGEKDTAWEIEEEYNDPSWGCSGSFPVENHLEEHIPSEDQTTAGRSSGHLTLAQVVADWDSTGYGQEYLSLQNGDELRVQVDNAGQPQLYEGWAYAFSERLASWGYYPPGYATRFVSVE